MDYYKIGQKIRKYRKAYNLSQEQLAEKVGISVTHMSHIETGNTKLSLPVLADISKALDIRSDDLLFDSAVEKTIYVEELCAILEDCSPKEVQIITETAKSLKISLRKYSQ